MLAAEHDFMLDEIKKQEEELNKLKNK